MDKFYRHKDPQSLDKLELATQTLKIEGESWLTQTIYSPYVGDSIPPRATKKH